MLMKIKNILLSAPKTTAKKTSSPVNSGLNKQDRCNREIQATAERNLHSGYEYS